MSTSLNIFIVLIVAFLMAALFITAWLLASKVIHPGKYSCPQLTRFVYCGNPQEEFGFAFEDVYFITPDDFFISAWFVPSSRGAKKAVILVHGWGTDRHEMMRYVPSLHKAGFHLLLLDLRNCGKSQKSFNSMGFYEKQDVLAAARFLLEKKQMKTLGILGISLGAATSVMSMAREPKIKAGFFEGGYSSVREVLAERVKFRYGLPLFPLFPLAMFFFQWRIKAKLQEIEPKKDIATIAPRTVFIVQGSDDITVFPQNGDRLFIAAGEPKNLYLQKGGRHAAAWNLETEKIEKMVIDFFKKNLR